jgi:DNA-binding MarR family transcriptional regulator
MDNMLMQTITDLIEGNPDVLSPLAAGVLAAAHHGLSQDSRSFAAKLGIAHALVLRECVALAEDHRLIDLDDRHDRSQRVFFSLTEQGHNALAKVHST